MQNHKKKTQAKKNANKHNETNTHTTTPQHNMKKHKTHFKQIEKANSKPCGKKKKILFCKFYSQIRVSSVDIRTRRVDQDRLQILFVMKKLKSKKRLLTPITKLKQGLIAFRKVLKVRTINPRTYKGFQIVET